eukprot:2264625-Rhodomonas_salina.1
MVSLLLPQATATANESHSRPWHSRSRTAASPYSPRYSVVLPVTPSSTRAIRRPAATAYYWQKQVNSSPTNGRYARCAGTYGSKHQTRPCACTQTR